MAERSIGWTTIPKSVFWRKGVFPIWGIVEVIGCRASVGVVTIAVEPGDPRTGPRRLKACHQLCGTASPLEQVAVAQHGTAVQAVCLRCAAANVAILRFRLGPWQPFRSVVCRGIGCRGLGK